MLRCKEVNEMVRERPYTTDVRGWRWLGKILLPQYR